MDPLQTFSEIYGEIPEWVDVMNQYAPQVLQDYTALRMHVMADGALTRREKELILVGINAARRYETSMMYHTKGAIDAGATPGDIADCILATVISRGLPAWLEGQKAVRYARQYASVETPDGQAEVTPESDLFGTVEAAQHYYEETFGTMPAWASLMREEDAPSFVSYTNMRYHCLKHKHVSEMLKELVLVGINAAERYPEGVEIHVRGARSKGASTQQIAECLFTALLTAGIPAWFTGYKHLLA